MPPSNRAITLTVVVAALGYFVDIYDLLLFGIVRVSSLRELGVPADNILDVGLRLINLQMLGMLLGGIIWGVLGDKKGRLSVLFGSIFLYSTANIANAYVSELSSVTGLSIEVSYGVLRFLAGVGLAGELGAAITLVGETMSKETRGYGTALVASIGILGAVVGSYIGTRFHWQTAYIIGGVLGFLLLALRISMFESGLFDQIKHRTEVKKGSLMMLFTNRHRLKKYLCCILIGLPIWFVIGILITFSPELTKSMGIPEGSVTAASAIFWSYLFLALGDLVSGFTSQWIKSRKKVIFAFLLLTSLFITLYCFLPLTTAREVYILCGLLGFGCGYWAVFVTVASEQFGTNLRSTVATTVPNFVRGSVVPLTLLFTFLKGHLSLTQAAFAVGLTSMTIAFIALYGLEETHSKDLNFLELTP
jgi:putative MFS transporter